MDDRGGWTGGESVSDPGGTWIAGVGFDRSNRGFLIVRWLVSGMKKKVSIGAGVVKYL
jgi:hypothetical protein